MNYLVTDFWRVLLMAWGSQINLINLRLQALPMLQCLY